MDHFDLAIIGSGSGNTLVTPDFDDARVAIIEAGPFGGTCLNVGCIPTKMFVYAAEVAETVRRGARYGVDSHVDGVRWTHVRDRIFGRIDPISSAGLHYRAEGPNTAAYTGWARFTAPRRLRVDLADGTVADLSADQVVIATGSHCDIPDVVSDSGVAYHTSDTIMRLERLPESLVILGGGYIAAEFAHVFSGLGVDVRVVVRGPAMLRHHDGDISRRFTDLATARWDVHLGASVVRIEPAGRSGATDPVGPPGTPEPADGVRLVLGDGTAVTGDMLLVATGRVPTTADLGVDAAGVALHPDGRVRVDEHGRTTAEGVWALGDVCSPYLLKHVANHEARVVAHNLVHPDELRSFDHRYVPAAVFSEPQVAAVGETEEALQARGARYVAKVQRYGDTAYGWAMEDTTGICKLLADPATGMLLGAHILGPHAATLIQPAIGAMSFGQRADDLASGQYWIHPALSEVLENALLGLELDPAMSAGSG